jgi:hypothetical protein
VNETLHPNVSLILKIAAQMGGTFSAQGGGHRPAPSDEDLLYRLS